LAYAHDEKPFVIGGGEIYAKAIEIADKLEVTRVHTTIEGDAFFPEIDPKKMKIINLIFRF